jgi:hypothetical protein
MAGVTKLADAIKQEYPTLTIGENKFICRTDKLPFGTMLKYADDDMDLLAVRRLLVKVLSEDDLDGVWDAFDEVGVDDATEAIKLLIEQFTARPTQKP